MEDLLGTHVDAAIAAATAVAVAALAFLLKLARDFVADKGRQATSLRIVAVYIRLAMEGWDDPGFINDSDAPDGKSIASLPSAIDAIQDPTPATAGKLPYMPFVPFSPHDNLTVAEVRDFLGHLNSETIECAVRFIQADAMTHALAEDLRSEYVRRDFTPERKIALVRQYSNEVVLAYKAAEEALETLKPFEMCPRLFWSLPFGYRFWRLAVWIWQLIR